MNQLHFATLQSHCWLFINQHPAATAIACTAVAVVCCVAALITWRVTRAVARRGWSGHGLGMASAAVLATGVSAQGMWVFMGESLHLSGLWRIVFFAFLENMVITSALRARAAQRTGASSGTDGIAMWLLTGLSALLSATDADNSGTMVLRLTAPLVAAWGWHRNMALERHSNGHQHRLVWTITPRRVLTRLGLLEPDPDRKTDLQRTLAAVALAAEDARTLRDSGHATARQLRRVTDRLRTEMRRATANGLVVPGPDQDPREILIDHLALLRNTTALLDLEIPDPWQPRLPTVAACTTSSAEEATQHDLDAGSHESGSDAPQCSTPTMPVSTAKIAGGNTAPFPPTAAVPEAPSDNSAELSAPCSSKVMDTPTASSARTGAQRSIRLVRDACAGEPLDEWAHIAEQVCSEDPSRRRSPEDVREILHLWHNKRESQRQIAQVTGHSRHAVGRVIRQARRYDSHRYAEQTQ